MKHSLIVLAVASLAFAGCANRSETDNTNSTNPPAATETSTMNGDTNAATDTGVATDTGTGTVPGAATTTGTVQP